ncbi:MAG: beta-lactamase family protein [Parachlamydiaceae bacterium]|nr:beta-lactamase family protein [Parachlamydiaceae bacterium]
MELSYLQGKISLDADVNVYLKRWKVPENDFTKSEKVTLRRLLSHTAGTSINGFPGYSTLNPTPKITEILKGEKPIANTDSVVVISTPGTELKYSGGGTTIVQLLIEDVTGEPFDLWMKKNVLDSLGMFESTFTQPLPSAYTLHAAYGHYSSGESVKGNWHIYPEMAAAGLWTTARDLAQFMIYVQRALKNENPTVLNNFYVKEMISRQKINGKEIDAGLGFFLNNVGEDLVFTHGGQDEGFISRLYGYAFRGQGAIIMINNDSAWGLMDEITNSIADTYRWPHFNPIERKVTHIDPFGFANLVGEYIKDEEIYKITLSNNQLFVDFKKGYGPLRLWSSAKCEFFIQEEDLTIDFLNCEEKNNQLTITDSKGVKTFFKKK